MHYSRSLGAFINGDGIPVVKVTQTKNRYTYVHPLSGAKLATSPATDEGIRWFAAKYWYRTDLEIRD